jgi:hypothetical protein
VFRSQKNGHYQSRTYKPGNHKILVKSSKSKDKQRANFQVSSKASINLDTVRNTANLLTNKDLENLQTKNSDHSVANRVIGAEYYLTDLKTAHSSNSIVKNHIEVDNLRESQELNSMKFRNHSDSNIFNQKKKGGKFLRYLLLLFSALLLFIGIIVLLWEGALGLLFAVPALFLIFLAIRGLMKINDKQFDKTKFKKLFKLSSIIIGVIVLLAVLYSSNIF